MQLTKPRFEPGERPENHYLVLYTTYFFVHGDPRHLRIRDNTTTPRIPGVPHNVFKTQFYERSRGDHKFGLHFIEAYDRQNHVFLTPTAMKGFLIGMASVLLKNRSETCLINFLSAIQEPDDTRWFNAQLDHIESEVRNLGRSSVSSFLAEGEADEDVFTEDKSITFTFQNLQADHPRVSDETTSKRMRISLKGDWALDSFVIKTMAPTYRCFFEAMKQTGVSETELTLFLQQVCIAPTVEHGTKLRLYTDEIHN